MKKMKMRMKGMMKVTVTHIINIIIKSNNNVLIKFNIRIMKYKNG